MRWVAPTLLALAVPAHADVVDEWRDLQGRCADAVTVGAVLDTAGLEARGPTVLVEPREVELDAGPLRRDPLNRPAPLGDPLGRNPVRDNPILRDPLEDNRVGPPEIYRGRTLTRFDPTPLRTSARQVPAGIWARPGGRFELHLLEYKTRPGTRAICEVFVARSAAALDDDEARAIFAAFDAAHDVDVDDPTRMVATLSEANPRGCKVLASVTRRKDYFRSSVAEAAGRPGCGGPSLTGTGGLNPAQVIDPEA